ncbi:MAG: glycoside hydrolase family 44 protein [Archangiaceae bacterium]|nr:glycoside hydrolase family 44 protein [Archangiaceae bacterium]
MSRLVAFAVTSFALSALAAPPAAEVAYRKGTQKGWMDFGWSPRKKTAGQAEQHDLKGYGGWILTREQPMRASQAGGLKFTYRAPDGLKDFLEMKLDKPGTPGRSWEKVRLAQRHLHPLPGGAVEVYVPMSELNPNKQEFDRIVFFAYRDLPSTWVTFDEVALTVPPTTAEPATAQPAVPTGTPRKVTIDCRGKGTPISPQIYGIAFYPLWEYRDDHHWAMHPAARRWGGNHSTRYNYQLGEAWNAGSDWYFRNLTYTNKPGWTWETFLETNAKHGVTSVITLPMMGWVAKDTTSSGYPVREFAEQQQSEQSSGAGNGRSKDGKWINAGSPTRTSIAAPPDFVAGWVKKIRQKATELKTPVTYILDNEPGLWDSTHHDVHPTAVGYDELWERTKAYASAVKRADPTAQIAGPAEWGWSNYLYSQKDLKSGGPRLRPDRRLHGDVPLIAWYLQKVAEYEKQTNVRLVDVLDLHFYPQADGIGIGESGDTSVEGSLKRLRSTRSLWDPTFRDESWIDDNVELIPRMKRWVAENAPGLGTSIGEWNFGAEKHISGGLAVAEALGRFGQQGLTSAYYWQYPPDGSAAYWGFRAYRDYDGKGAQFGTTALKAQAPAGASVFASTSADGSKVVVVLLNLDPQNPLDADLAFEGCGEGGARRVFSYAGGLKGLEPREAKEGPLSFEPFSINVIELSRR